MSLCPEHNKREAMSDAEFWSHVFGEPPIEMEAPFTLDDEPDIIEDSTACTECRSTGPCGYDIEGRPWIHIITEKDGD